MIAQNLAVYFAYLDRGVCIVDTDINQSSLLWTEKRGGGIPKIPVFLAHTNNLLKWLLPILRETYELIIIDGSPSNHFLTKSVVHSSDIILTPFLPSPVDWEITKQFIDKHIHITQNREKPVVI